MNDGQYAKCLVRLTEAERFKEPSPELKAQIAFMKASCHDKLGHTAEALGGYRYVVAQFPDSMYAYQAKERLQQLEAKL